MKTGNLLYNHEDKITNRLVENHLNASNSLLGFILQVPENYVPDEDRYKGRTDIRVISSDWFKNKK